MELRVTCISSALWTLLASPFAFADIACDKSYGLRVDVSGRTGVVICDSSSESFVDSINDFKRSNINYTKTSAVSAFGRFNDVDLALSYAARSTKLVYAFPQLGDAGSFTGATRKESQQMFEDYIKTSGIMGQIVNYQARNSPTSPITGAGGLVPITIASDFNANFSDSPTAIAGPSGAGNSDNLIGAGRAQGQMGRQGLARRGEVVTGSAKCMSCLGGQIGAGQPPVLLRRLQHGPAPQHVEQGRVS